MGLRMAAELTARPVARGEDDAPESELLRDGTPTGRRVSGAVLEAAVEWDGRYLLFMTDDTPSEDVLSIHLFDGHLEPLDSATLGGPYSTGSFSGLELGAPDRVAFRFIGETTWTVELLPARAFRLPFASDAPGVRRRPGFSRHFVVRGEPRPERR